ncbi:MAG: 2-oxoacid:ferredoxin oxidoreductase subunit beta [Polyangiales bacterium]
MQAKNPYPVVQPTDPSAQTRKDFTSDQEVRWCPGCGDYSILAQVQRVLPSFGIPKEKYVFVSGIGCSSRFPYYMDTYGIHSIHGRAPAIATGIKAINPDLTVWVVTGDGDALSIGGNHFLHVLRRNVDVKLLMFNNQIYGLTKGQYSPTSPLGKKAKSTPLGSVDYPADPVSVALGAGATFVARTLDVNVQHIQEILKRASQHKGTAFVEIFQNCNIFNDGAFTQLTEKETKADSTVEIVHGKPLRFGKNKEKGIVLDGSLHPKVVVVDEVGEDKLFVHDEQNELCALVLSRLRAPEFPTPIGVFRAVEVPSYDAMLNQQVDRAKAGNRTTVQDLLDDGAWTIS